MLGNGPVRVGNVGRASSRAPTQSVTRWATPRKGPLSVPIIIFNPISSYSQRQGKELLLLQEEGCPFQVGENTWSRKAKSVLPVSPVNSFFVLSLLFSILLLFPVNCSYPSPGSSVLSHRGSVYAAGALISDQEAFLLIHAVVPWTHLKFWYYCTSMRLCHHLHLGWLLSFPFHNSPNNKSKVKMAAENNLGRKKNCPRNNFVKPKTESTLPKDVLPNQAAQISPTDTNIKHVWHHKCVWVHRFPEVISASFEEWNKFMLQQLMHGLGTPASWAALCSQK